MISDWKHIEKSNLTIFMIDKLFVSSDYYRTIVDKKFIKIIYNYELPKEIINYYKNLEKIGINLIISFGDKYLEIDGKNTKKLNILYKILFENTLGSDIDEIVIKLNQKYTRIESFKEDINNIESFKKNINNDLFFNDIEIFVHALVINDNSIILKLKKLAYGEEKVSNYEEFKTKKGDIITYNIKEKIIKINEKIVKQSKQLLFCLVLLENKGKKCNYLVFEEFFKREKSSFTKNGKKDIGEQINTLYNNIKLKKSDLQPLFENIQIEKGSGYYIL